MTVICYSEPSIRPGPVAAGQEVRFLLPANPRIPLVAGRVLEDQWRPISAPGLHGRPGAVHPRDSLDLEEVCLGVGWGMCLPATATVRTGSAGVKLVVGQGESLECNILLLQGAQARDLGLRLLDPEHPEKAMPLPVLKPDGRERSFWT